MKLAPFTRYGIRIVSELAEAERPLSLFTLSERTGIAQRAVENVHAVLKQHGVTVATVGAGGGVTLGKALGDISLGQMITWLEDGVEFSVCCGEKAYECPQRDVCATRSSWCEVSSIVQQALDAISLTEILRLPAGRL